MRKYREMAGKKDKKEKEPQYIPSPLNNTMLNYRVYYMNAGEKILYGLVSFAVGGLVGEVFYGGLFKMDGEATFATFISNIVVFAVVGLLAMRFALPAITEMLLDRRNKKLEKQFMDFMENLSSSLSAGNTVNDSFVSARTDMLNQYSEGDMIIRELKEIVTGLENGQNLETMVQSWGTRSGNEDIENFANVITNCYRLGGNFKDVVRKTRDLISGKIAITNEINTKLASNKMQHSAMCVMPIVLVAMLRVSSPDFAANLSSFVGVAAITVAIGIFVGSFIWGRKIINIQ